MNQEFMREAIRISEEKMRAGRGGPFGAVIVRGDRIVGKGWNEVTASNDPTAHAEMVAIRDACKNLRTFRLDDCEMYASCEPCPMCLAAVYWARLKKLYFANTRRDAADIGFDDEFIYNQLAVPLGARTLVCEPCLREEAQAAFVEWKKKPDKIVY